MTAATLANFSNPLVPNSLTTNMPLVETVSGTLTDLRIYADGNFSSPRYRIYRLYDSMDLGWYPTQAAAEAAATDLISRGRA